MQKGDDFKNFLIIKKLEEERKEETFLDLLIRNKLKIISIVAVLILLFFFYKIFLSSTNYQDSENLFQINHGESIEEIARDLESKNIIYYKLPFKLYMKIFGGDSSAQAGIYRFEKGDNIISIAHKIIKAKYAIPPVRITIPEGSTNEEISEIINKAFSQEVNKDQVIDDFSKSNILLNIKDEEGYIYPETYFFLPNTNLYKVVSQLKNHFYINLKNLFENLKAESNNLEEEKYPLIYSLDMKEFNMQSIFNTESSSMNLSKRFTLINEIGTTTLSVKDIITMASYLEGEANNEKDMRIVSGALWTRLKLGYPLQIDAATSTYKNKGFTKTPINNPGLVAIKAAMNPIKTGYIYYITGNDGNMYYAKDYNTHLDNINKYLRNR